MDEIKGLYSVVDQKVQEDVPMFSAYIVSAQAAVNKRLSNATPSVYGFFNNVEQLGNYEIRNGKINVKIITGK